VFKKKLQFNLVMLLALILFSVGLGLVGGLVWFQKESTPRKPYELRLSGAYQYINPLLECELGGLIEHKSLAPFKRLVKDKVDVYLKSNQASEISVYYRELNDGQWFGIDEDKDFIGASLMKVPIMLAFFKQSQSDPDLLSTPVDISSLNEQINQYHQELENFWGVYDQKPYYPPEQAVEIDQTYTIGELIDRMIIESDNQARLVLSLLIDPEAVVSLELDLGIYANPADLAEDYLTVKEYSAIFRYLYNASYLDRDYSEQALILLSKSKFDRGLVAGVPVGVEVAHKFGEYGLEIDGVSTVQQLHDCGIVYHPVAPYLLCVMTRGQQTDNLANVIASISRLVYNQVEKRYANIQIY